MFEQNKYHFLIKEVLSVCSVFVLNVLILNVLILKDFVSAG